MTARADASARLEDARAFLESARAIDTLNDAESYADVIATNVVHAGIAASDAFCLLVVGRHSKSENHADAVNVLKAVARRRRRRRRAVELASRRPVQQRYPRGSSTAPAAEIGGRGRDRRPRGRRAPDECAKWKGRPGGLRHRRTRPWR